jgi:putative transposase
LNEKTTASSSTRSVGIPERSTVVKDGIDALEDFRKQLEGADVNLLRGLVKVFAEQLMGADADALCGADYGERSPERVNRRNGYRERPWDTRAGTIAPAVPKLREGTCFPEWLLEPRRRAERAFVAS